MTDLSKMIRFHRKRAGLTQAQLADLAGLGKTVVFDVEHGKDTIKWSTLKRVLEVLNISIKFESPLLTTFEENNDANR